MKKTTLILVASGLLLVSLFVTAEVKLTKANFIPYGTVTILSPSNQTTYNSQFLTLNFSASFVWTDHNWRNITYSIDGGDNVTISGLPYSEDIWERETTNGSITLPKLSDGQHRIEMYTDNLHSGTGYSLVYFTIKSTLPNTTLSSSPTSQPTVNTGQHVNYGVGNLPYVIGIVAIFIIAIMGLLVYFKKLHKEQLKHE